MKIIQEYAEEKAEAYNVAIEALRMHEPGSDCDLELASMLRGKLAKKLEREIQTWWNKFAP